MTALPSSIPKPCCLGGTRMQLRVSATARPAQTKSATMYELLSVEKTAGPEEIKAAYRVQARRWHPDACRTAVDKAYFAERFIRAREAYEVLSDPSRRRDYDVSLLRADGWAIAVGGGVVLRNGGGAWGFGDWVSQLEGLKRRRSGARQCAGGEDESWGSRMRRAHDWKASD
ncbi:unnamed protein product [Musa banksii]